MEDNLATRRVRQDPTYLGLGAQKPTTGGGGGVPGVVCRGRREEVVYTRVGVGEASGQSVPPSLRLLGEPLWASPPLSKAPRGASLG